ncbi:MAG TPA: hypothetical protein ACFYD9_04465 [Candidatus Wunengus sp. YC64]
MLVNMVYEAIRNSPSFQKDFRLSSQITAIAGSGLQPEPNYFGSIEDD